MTVIVCYGMFSMFPAKQYHQNRFIFSQITQIYIEIVYYLMSPSEEARRVDVWMRFILIVRHLNVVPHAVVYPGHDA